MVLISTENLERMQRQLQQPTETMENTRNLDANNSVRTPGTPLSRLDAEMNCILNSSLPLDEKWKKYKEALWRYLHFARVRKKQQAGVNDTDNTVEEEEGENAGEEIGGVDDDVTLRAHETDAVPSHSSSFIQRINNAKDRELLKSGRKIVQSVPKSYRANAFMLMKLLLDKAAPTRISWDEHGVVTIDGNVVQNSNIGHLINDAMRERKTVKAVGRVQFARLLRSLNIPPVLVRNKELLNASSSNVEKPVASSTPNKSRTESGRRTRKRKEHEEEANGHHELFFSRRYRKFNTPITFKKNTNSPSARKRRLLDWCELK